ncbi:MAG: hypothetical protein WBF37_05270, partial [Dehalococcoidia bacterium]
DKTRDDLCDVFVHCAEKSGMNLALYNNQYDLRKTWSEFWPFQIVIPQVLFLAGLIWPVFLILFSAYDSR